MNKKDEIIITGIKEKIDVLFKTHEDPMDITLNLISLGTYFFSVVANQKSMIEMQVFSFLEEALINGLCQFEKNVDNLRKEKDNE